MRGDTSSPVCWSWVPIGITIWVLAFLVGTLDQTLLVLPESRAPRQRARVSHSRPGRGPDHRDRPSHRRHRRELLRRACDRRVGIDARPHSVRQVDLHQRQAGERHPALRLGYRVSQGAAGRISVSRVLDDCLPDRDAGHCSDAVPPRASTSASTSPPRRTRHRAISSCCRSRGCTSST